MDDTLKNILGKLAKDRAAASLTDADFTYLARFAADEKKRDQADAPAPLWRFLRRNTLLFKDLFGYNLDSECDAILVDAGASPDRLKGYAQEVRLTATVTRDALKRSVRRHLTNDSTSTRAHATRLVGLLGLTDTAGVIAESLESGREERRDWGIPVMAASLEALTMLRHPQTRSLAMKWVGHEDWSLRRAAQVAALAAEGTPTNEQLKKILESQFEWSVLRSLPKVFLAAAKNGALVEDDLDTILAGVPAYVAACGAIADLVVGAEWRRGFKKLLEHADRDHRAAAAVRAAWTKTSWLGPIARECLEESDAASDARMCLVTAVATCGEGGVDEAFVRARFASDDVADKLGAIWATVGTGKFDTELREVLKTEDMPTRRAARAALAVSMKDPAKNAQPLHVDLAWTDLLNNEDAWWPWGLPLAALQMHGVKLPACAEIFSYVARDTGRFEEADLERVITLCREHPIELLRWLRADAPASQRTRALAFAGLAEEASPGLFADAIEHALLDAESSDVALSAALEVLSGRGPTSKSAEVKAAIALFEQPRPIEGALLPTAVHASRGDSLLRKRATLALSSYGSDAEPYLAMLLASADAEVARVAADVVAQLSAPTDPLLADVARLLSGDTRKLSELHALDRLVTCLSPRVRSALAELAALPDSGLGRDEVIAHFAWLVVDRDADVAAAALGALAVQASDVLWVRELVLSETWSPDTRTKDKAIAAAGQMADRSFVPRLLELVDEPEGSTSKDNAVRGLERIAERHPDLGLAIFDIREPNKIASRYALNDQVDWNADKHTEGLRLFLLGLDRRKDAGEAKKHVGRKVMISPAAGDENAAGHGASWSSTQVEGLVMYLHVVYTDEETRSIVAEVSEDPTAEVLSAILQSTSVAVCRFVWS